MEAEVEELVAPNVNKEQRWWLRFLRRRDSSVVGKDGVGLDTGYVEGVEEGHCCWAFISSSRR